MVVTKLLSYALFILGLGRAILGSKLIERTYIVVGLLALIGLAALGATSNRWSMCTNSASAGSRYTSFPAPS